MADMGERRVDRSGPGSGLDPRASPARGRLKVFFGYAAGVGKTRAMLQAAQHQVAGGTRVLLGGYSRSSPAESFDPEALTPGIDVLGSLEQGGFDLDEALRRKPDLLLLPGLAHMNPTGARHRRRHQDVEELLEAGVDVWSTLDVGHIESLADLAERIAGSPMENTIPDAVFDVADEVELIDLPPENLLDRIRRDAAPRPDWAGPHGAIPERAALVALREIALRRAADRLNSREQALRESGPPKAAACPTVERLLVCVGPSPTSARVVRTASRMARSVHAQWIAVHAGRMNGITQEEEHRVVRHLRLAESLGARTAILPGGDVAQEIVEFARSHGVTKIIIGKTGRPGWRSWLRRPLVDQIIAASGDADVYVIRGVEEPGDRMVSLPLPKGSRIRGYAGAIAALCVATAVAAAFEILGLTKADVVLAYLLGVTAVAAWLGRGPAVFASFGAVLLFNFFFTSPRYTLHVHDSAYVFTFAVMLVIGLLVSTLTSRIRDQSIAARQRERRTEQLYELSQELSATAGHLQIVTAAEARLSALLGGDVSILIPDEGGDLRGVGPRTPRLQGDQELLSVATWVYEHGRIAGAGTETHADAPVVCLPLSTPEGVVGVVAVGARDPDLILLPDRRRLVETFAAQVALAIQRDRLAEQVHRTFAQADNERLRSAVLSSVSHDFRTPLAAIVGASSSLLDTGERAAPEERQALLLSIYEEADRLARLVDNLLYMTRLESGHLEPKREWNIVEDIVGSALTRLAPQLVGRDVVTRIPRVMPMIRVDGVLIDLVLSNLIDNAIKYSPSGSPIEVSARVEGQHVLLDVTDHGPGLTAEEKERAFEKFYRGPRRRGDGSRGAGLGLAICVAISRIHGGSLAVRDREGGGACFVLALPIEEQPPAIDGHEMRSGGGGSEA
jgi:two-component system sensor histidine kinase KdpD